MKKIMVCFTFFLTAFSAAFGVILPVKTLQPLQELIPSLHADTLVVFDCDDVLIIPKDKLLRACGQDVFQKYRKKLELLGYEKANELASKLMLQRKIEFVHPEIVSIFQQLQRKGIKVIMLTAMRTGPYGQISSLEEWRYEELKRMGLDFNLAFPELAPITFENLGCGQELPVFKKGVFASCSTPKGIALGNFLDQLAWKPTQVLFVDDRKHCVVSVENEMENRSIKVVCFLDQAVMSLNEQVDETIAEMQFNHLMQYEQWLSDEEVLQLSQ